MNTKVDTHKEDNEKNIVYVTFTLPELWLMSDHIRHEVVNEKEWVCPPSSFMLNEEISLAIFVCETFSVNEYTIPLTRKDIAVIDSNIRRDFKTPEGASGKTVLLKCYKAINDLKYNNLEAPSSLDKMLSQAQKKKIREMFNADDNKNADSSNNT